MLVVIAILLIKSPTLLKRKVLTDLHLWHLTKVHPYEHRAIFLSCCCVLHHCVQNVTGLLVVCDIISLSSYSLLVYLPWGSDEKEWFYTILSPHLTLTTIHWCLVYSAPGKALFLFCSICVWYELIVIHSLPFFLFISHSPLPTGLLCTLPQTEWTTLSISSYFRCYYGLMGYKGRSGIGKG